MNTSQSTNVVTKVPWNKAGLVENEFHFELHTTIQLDSSTFCLVSWCKCYKAIYEDANPHVKEKRGESGNKSPELQTILNNPGLAMALPVMFSGVFQACMEQPYYLSLAPEIGQIIFFNYYKCKFSVFHGLFGVQNGRRA